jgi:hypothetical protein
MNKAARLSIAFALILAMLTIGFANATPKPLKQANMVYWTSLDEKQLPVPGNQVSDFKLTLNESVQWYYLDIKFIKPTLPRGAYQFYLNPPEDPDFWAYWTEKGVTSTATYPNWQWWMWHIISGTPAGTLGPIPMFALYSYGDGTYYLSDALTFYSTLLSGFPVLTHLRLNGDYPKGTYTFTCKLCLGLAPVPPNTPINNYLDDVSISITFK